MVVGDEPGPAKLAKAESYGIKTITEDELLDLILIKSNMEPKYVKNSAASTTTSTTTTKTTTTTSNNKSSMNEVKAAKKPKLQEKASTTTIKQSKTSKQSIETNVNPVTIINETQPKKLTQSQDLKPIPKIKMEIDLNNMSWTDKYKPQSIKDIIGQQGNDSSMRKLYNWLQNWYKTFPKKSTGIPRGYADLYKCALLSGAPGVG